MGSKWFGKKRVDSSDLAEMLVDALDTAFERHLPNPQDIADAIEKAISNATFSSAEKMGKINAAVIESQEALVTKWEATVTALDNHTSRIEQSDRQLAAVLKDVTDANAKHIHEIKDVTTILAKQLSNVAQVAEGIENILKVQETVDGLVKQVVTSEKFVSMITAVEEHLQETNKLLEIAAQPRTVRLVESESDE